MNRIHITIVFIYWFIFEANFFFPNNEIQTKQMKKSSVITASRNKRPANEYWMDQLTMYRVMSYLLGLCSTSSSYFRNQNGIIIYSSFPRSFLLLLLLSTASISVRNTKITEFQWTITITIRNNQKFDFDCDYNDRLFFYGHCSKFFFLWANRPANGWMNEKKNIAIWRQNDGDFTFNWSMRQQKPLVHFRKLLMQIMLFVLPFFSISFSRRFVSRMKFSEMWTLFWFKYSLRWHSRRSGFYCDSWFQYQHPSN